MKAIYNTKYAHLEHRNGEEVEIIDMKRREETGDRYYTIKFRDGEIIKNVFSAELKFAIDN